MAKYDPEYIDEEEKEIIEELRKEDWLLEFGQLIKFAMKILSSFAGRFRGASDRVWGQPW